MPYFVIRIVHPSGVVEYFNLLSEDAHASEKWFDTDIQEATRYTEDRLDEAIDDASDIRELYPLSQVGVYELSADGTSVLEVEDYL